MQYSVSSYVIEMLKMDINAALLEIENLVSSENQENEDLKIYLTKKIKKDGRFYIVSLR